MWACMVDIEIVSYIAKSDGRMWITDQGDRREKALLLAAAVLATSGEPNKKMGSRTADAPFRVQIPANVDLKLEVQCENHKPWTYPDVINVRSGKDFVLDIKMQPAAAAVP